MAHAAVCQACDLHVILFHEIAPELLLVVGLLPFYVENFITWANLVFRGAMTLEAPFHVERILLPSEGHLLDRPVTRRAANAFVHMDAVIKVDKVRQVVDAVPLNRYARRKALADRFQQGSLSPKL